MEPPKSSPSSSSRPAPVKGILKNRSGSGGGGGGGLGLAAAAHHSPAKAARPPEAEAPPRRRPPGRDQPQQPPPPPPPPQEEPEPPEPGKKSQKWDEMNILATYHPAGKDYGLMKIDEPSTPYHSMVGDDEDGASDTESNEALTADVLAEKLAAAAEGKGPKILAEQESTDEEEDDEDLTPEELEKKRQFEMKRKMHYNEAQNIKLARQLIEKELRGEAASEEDGDEEMQDTAGLERRSPELAPARS
ncbi:protein phosphatase inhibitor 2 isoform X2 [Hemicordylus capensis]|uniref:protein phosphatase inhibitor 2 isoform X2 n=1 Tax=Hemicordylus capensis TaxID=884348 RepID=UPI002304BC13|nr:protein phosphatase inhibitor 2 isoform X2 [Hemicordylus capensis]